MKEEHGHQHDPDGRGIQEDRRRGERHDRNGLKITDGEKEDAAEAQAQKQRQIPRFQPEALPLLAQQKQTEYRRCHRHPEADNLNGAKAVCVELSDENAHTSPKDACQNNERRAVIGFPVFH